MLRLGGAREDLSSRMSNHSTRSVDKLKPLNRERSGSRLGMAGSAMMSQSKTNFAAAPDYGKSSYVNHSAASMHGAIKINEII